MPEIVIVSEILTFPTGVILPKHLPALNAQLERDKELKVFCTYTDRTTHPDPNTVIFNTHGRIGKRRDATPHYRTDFPKTGCELARFIYLFTNYWYAWACHMKIQSGHKFPDTNHFAKMTNE